jgi:hypothetical protein
MFLKQLNFNFYDSLEKSRNITCNRQRTNPYKVYPDDITFFLDKYLPEYKEGILDGRLSEGNFRMPRLEAVHNITPENLIPFNAVMSLSCSELSGFDFFHFFVHDYQFERLWNNPTKYLPFLLRIGQGFGPDFSMYNYMHPAEAIINCCRNRLLTFYLQQQGLIIPPNVCFGDEQTFSWAFDGLPEHSVLVLTTQGCMRNRTTKRTVINGIHEVDRRKHPELLYVYGEFPDEWMDKFGMEIKPLPTFSDKWRRAN